jgi:superoxide reductase
MTQLLQVYKCEVCGNIVEMVHEGKGQLVCCGQPMVLQAENTVDASREKHVPVVEKTAGGVKVKVGSAPHPMEEKHYIEWVEVIDGASAQRIFLKPGQAPEAAFCVGPGEVTPRAYCNIHGLWKG